MRNYALVSLVWGSLSLPLMSPCQDYYVMENKVTDLACLLRSNDCIDLQLEEHLRVVFGGLLFLGIALVVSLLTFLRAPHVGFDNQTRSIILLG